MSRYPSPKNPKLDFFFSRQELVFGIQGCTQELQFQNISKAILTICADIIPNSELIQLPKRENLTKWPLCNKNSISFEFRSYLGLLEHSSSSLADTPWIWLFSGAFVSSTPLFICFPQCWITLHSASPHHEAIHNSPPTIRSSS